MKPLTREENFLAKIAGDTDADENMKPITREEHYLDQIAGMMNNAASEVPAVSASDNGKVLTVVDGAWAAAQGGGGEGSIAVTTAALADDYYTLDMTWAEILSAVKGKTPVFILIDSGEGAYMDMANDVYLDGGTYIVYTLSGSQYETDAESGYPSRYNK